MRASLICAMLLTLSAAPGFAAERSPACEAKRAAIETQISEATTRGRSQEIAGLKKALAANKARCTDASLAKERDGKILTAQKKLAAREKSLAEAQSKGDAKKIADRQAKLDAARRDLAEAEKPVGQ